MQGESRNNDVSRKDLTSVHRDEVTPPSYGAARRFCARARAPTRRSSRARPTIRAAAAARRSRSHLDAFACDGYAPCLKTGHLLTCATSSLEAHLDAFARDGLRTLVLAQRDLPRDEYARWAAEWKAAETATVGRAGAMAAAAARVERDLVVVGATAIEDKLQDDVPATIAELAVAGIKIWVLTGDKVEMTCRVRIRFLNHCDVTDPNACERLTGDKARRRVGVGFRVPASSSRTTRLFFFCFFFGSFFRSLTSGFENQEEETGGRSRGGPPPVDHTPNTTATATHKRRCRDHRSRPRSTSRTRAG